MLLCKLSTMNRCWNLLLILLAAATAEAHAQPALASSQAVPGLVSGQGFADAALFGFSPKADGLDNARALQRAVDRGGTIVVAQPGTYQIADTVYIGGNTSLYVGNNVFLKKVAEQGGFSQVLLNKGALTKTYDQNITIEGLQIVVNGVDDLKYHVFGLRGQLAFFY